MKHRVPDKTNSADVKTTWLIRSVGSTNMKKAIFIPVLFALSISAQCWAGKVEIPSFLPEYYLPAFQVDGQDLLLMKHSTEDNVDQWMYSTKEQSLGLVVENIKCDRPRSRGIFNNILGYLNKEIGDKKGAFLEITEREINARIIEENAERSVFVYIVPTSIHIWSYSIDPRSRYQSETAFKSIRAIVNRQRYTDALSEGNVAMGFWGPQIYEYASQLLREGKRKTALTVFNNLLTTSPFNYEAHTDFMENSNDPKSTMNSARIVFRNAEDSKLIEKAARFLKMDLKTRNSVPLLKRQETGLQLILIPLGPCNILLLEEAAKTYEKITGITTKIRQLPEEWHLNVPDRIPFQRRIQEILVKMKKQNIDFAGWAKEKYVEELLKGVELEDALSQYYVRDLIDTVNKEPGQYFVDPHLDWFCKALMKYRSNDHRTMYVGITAVNIYSGDNNYVFSLGTTGGPSRASILSYHMMLAKTLSEEFQSRQRLTERIAKELVPASLKQLGIPRSTDPTCPYSYSSGVSRLDQKTMNLSDSVKEALKNLVIQPTNSSDLE
ncbi:MAG: hypothetical protein SVW57_05615 [Thermodesulfobacteriota bacterium]|nr:hypothetical protein [Thermodesulfobacteriota bacterium]